MKTNLQTIAYILCATVLSGCALKTADQEKAAAAAKKLAALEASLQQVRTELQSANDQHRKALVNQQALLQLEFKQERAGLEDQLTASQAQLAILEAGMAETGGSKEASGAADFVTLASGKVVPCRILSYATDRLWVELPDGERFHAKLSAINDIRFRGLSEEGFAALKLEEEKEHSPPAGSSTGEKPAVATPVAPVHPRTDPLALSPYWKAPIPGGNLILKDLDKVFFGKGKPQVNLDPVPGLMLYEDIYYLMPAQQAFAALGVRPVPRVKMDVAGFPKNSFFYYDFAGNFEKNYPNLLLITDLKDQVIGIQLMDEKGGQKPKLLKEIKSYNYIDFIQNRRKGGKDDLIAHWIKVDPENQRVELYTEVIDRRYNKLLKIEDTARTRERIKLVLAQPVLDLILQVMSTY